MRAALAEVPAGTELLAVLVDGSEVPCLSSGRDDEPLRRQDSGEPIDLLTVETVLMDANLPPGPE